MSDFGLPYIDDGKNITEAIDTLIDARKQGATHVEIRINQPEWSNRIVPVKRLTEEEVIDLQIRDHELAIANLKRRKLSYDSKKSD